MKKQWMLVVAVVAALSLLGVTPAAWASDRDTIIRLDGSRAYPSANGKAKYANEGGEKEFEVEVEDARSLAGQTLAVIVDGRRVGSLKLNRIGDGELNLNSDEGDQVPTIVSGSRVRVRTSDGTLVVSGRFR